MAPVRSVLLPLALAALSLAVVAGPAAASGADGLPLFVSPLAWTFIIEAIVVVAAIAAFVGQGYLVRLSVDEPRQRVNAGTDGVFLIRVTNAGRKPRNVHLRVERPAAPYVAALSYPTLELAARETADVPLYVRVPVSAQATGPVAIQVSARPNSYSPWLASTQVTVDVVDLRHGDDAEPSATAPLTAAVAA